MIGQLTQDNAHGKQGAETWQPGRNRNQDDGGKRAGTQAGIAGWNKQAQHENQDRSQELDADGPKHRIMRWCLRSQKGADDRFMQHLEEIRMIAGREQALHPVRTRNPAGFSRPISQQGEKDQKEQARYDNGQAEPQPSLDDQPSQADLLWAIGM